MSNKASARAPRSGETERLQSTIPKELYLEIEKLAEASEVTVSYYVRKVLRDHVQGEKNVRRKK